MALILFLAMAVLFRCVNLLTCVRNDSYCSMYVSAFFNMSDTVLVPTPYLSLRNFCVGFGLTRASLIMSTFCFKSSSRRTRFLGGAEDILNLFISRWVRHDAIISEWYITDILWHFIGKYTMLCVTFYSE